MNIGFVMNWWHNHGGVATWAKTLISRLMETDTVRLGIYNYKNSDIKSANSLGCEVFDSCRKVAWRSDVLVLWHTGKETPRILDKTPLPPTITVSHEGEKSEATREAIRHQAKWSSRYVYVEPTAIGSIPLEHQHLSVCIPNAPDPRLCRVSSSRSEFRKSIGVSSEQVLLGMMTRITPAKGIHLIADAVRLLGDNFRFVVSGRIAGKSHEAYAKALARSGVILLPPQDTHNLLYASDFSVSASESEGNSYSLLESLLAGVPVVSTRVGLLNTNPQLARITKPSVDAIAEAIRLDWDDVQGRVLRACASRQWIADNASVDVFMEKWRRLIYETANKST